MLGEQMADDKIVSENGEILGRQVSFDIDGTRVKVDKVAKMGDDVFLVEVKNGPSARLTHNQRIAYPKLSSPLPELPKGMSISDFLSHQAPIQPSFNVTPIGGNTPVIWESGHQISGFKFLIIHF